MFYAVSPAAGSTPYHSHVEQEKAFQVLEGEMGCSLNGTMSKAAAGEVIIVPAGKPPAQ